MLIETFASSFLHGGHSWKPLKITKLMLARILTYHQVMPSYLDFISIFGAQSEARGLRFAAFREQTFLSNPPKALEIADLRRSGRQYQLSYNLKGVACKSEDGTIEEKKEWSIRQVAIHHQFDVVYGTTLWIVIKGDLEIKERVQAMTGIDGSPEDKAFETPGEAFKSSLAAHLLYSQWSLEEWRWYIHWLEDRVEQVVSLAQEMILITMLITHFRLVLLWKTIGASISLGIIFFLGTFRVFISMKAKSTKREWF